MIKAVITGDVVQSTKLAPDERSILVKAIKRTLKQWDNEFGMQSELYRGDSFQCLIHDPKYALRMALLIRTYIRSLNPTEAFDIYKRENPDPLKSALYTKWMFDARLAIGIGEVDDPLEEVKISDGEAFQLSGRELDEIKNGRQMMAIKTNDNNAREVATEVELLDFIISKATALQCEVVNLKLLGNTEINIAKELKINQSAVNQRSISAGWNAINNAVKRFEEIYQQGNSISLAKLFHDND